MSAWWHSPFRTFQTNLREVDAGLDVERVLDAIEAHGADTWLLSVGGIIANHPSDLASQTVNPHLAARASGDLVGDAVTAAARRGIRVLGRMDFSKLDAARAEEHPEWCFVAPTGEPQIYNGYRSTCPSGPYYQEAVFDVLDEVLSRYDLAGFFFNWMSFNEVDYSRRYWGVCRCEACLVGFRAFSGGADHPTGPDSPTYALWRRFGDGVLDDLHARVRAHIAGISPDVGLILGDRADITFHEANNAVGRPLWHLHTAEGVSAARSGDDTRPVFVNAVGFVDTPYRWAGEDPHHLAQYLVQAIAHGAQPSTYVMGTPEDSPFEALDEAARITRFHRDHEDVYDGLRSAAEVALVRRTGGRGPAPDAVSEFQGHYLGLVEGHVPFDVVRQDRLDRVPVGRYRLLILPDLGPLAPSELEAVLAALDAGATVVATGSSGWSDGELQLRRGEPLARRRAVLSGEDTVRSLHLPLGPRGRAAPVVGDFAVLEAAEGAATAWHALGRAAHGPPEACHGHLRTSHPGWIAGEVGAGRLAVLPWLPGHVYRHVGLSPVRDSVLAAILELAGDPVAVDTDLPSAAHLVLGRVGERSVVHVLNRSGDATQRFVEPLPLAAATLRLPAEQDPVAVRARVAGTDLDWTRRDGLLEITTPVIGRFEVIELVPGPSTTGV